MRKASRVLISILFCGAGIAHFVVPHVFEAIVPPILVWPIFFVYLSGFLEIVLGLALLNSRCREYAAWGLISLLVAVFPANVYMALYPGNFPLFDQTALWLRLPLQAVLIAWVWYARRDHPLPS